MIRCLIVDDEPLARQIISKYVNEQPELQLVGTCSNAIEAFEVLHREQINLIFLDIKMPAINGMDFIKSLSHAPAVIFTTAYPEYAADSYEVAAIDYLLKPITLERFQSSIRKYLSINQSAANPVHSAQQPENQQADNQKNYTFFKVNGKFLKLEHQEIRYAQSIKDYIILHTETGNHITHMTMKYLEELLPSNQFVRIHRSYLVNKEKVTRLDKKEVQIAEEMLPVGKSYATIPDLLRL